MDFSLHSTKFNGSLHYRYPVRLIEQTDERLVTYFEAGGPVESYRGKWIGEKHFLSFFWRGRPYVLHVRWENGWEPEFLYVDIATNVRWDEQTVRYVDLDLDLILRADSTNIHLDDEDEFEAHRVKWNYPPSLVTACWAAVEEVKRQLRSGKKPFDLSIFDWRPGSTVADS